MLLTVQAVADMAPTSTNTLTWRSDGTYTVTSTLAKDTFVHIRRTAGPPVEDYLLDPKDWRLSNATTLVIDSLANARIRHFTITAIQAAVAQFRLPTRLRSWNIRNISGADIFFRARIPNIAGHVIDTTAKTFSDVNIVGQKLLDGEAMFFSEGDFTPGREYVTCSAADRADGAILQFNF